MQMFLEQDNVMQYIHTSSLSLYALFLLRQHLLYLQRSHTATPRTRNRLPVPFILDVARSKDTLDGGLGGARDGDDVPVRVGLELSANKGGGGFVA